MGVYEFVRPRIPEAEASQDLLTIICETVIERLTLRLGVDELPDRFERIAADAAVKMFRRVYYEGITTENAADISVSFVDDILAEYAAEIDQYRASVSGVVRFL